MKTCFACKRKVYIVEKHHIVPKSLGGKTIVELCINCHNLIHDMQRTSISNLMKKCWDKKRKLGHKIGRYTQFGYDAKDGVLIPNSKEQTTIKFILNMRKQGASYQCICNHLNRRKMKTKTGKPWCPKTVRDIVLKNLKKERRVY